MTITDAVTERNSSHTTDVLRRSSLNVEIHRPKLKSSLSNDKFKRLHTSVLDLLNWHRPKDGLETKTTYPGLPKASALRRPSTIKTSDMSRTISKKSVTFASAFNLAGDDDEDDDDDDYEKDRFKFDLETNIHNEMPSEEDLITIIPNKGIDNESTSDPSEIMEPYPFRSEIPLSSSPQSNSPVEITTKSHHTKRKLIHNFIYQRHPKKLRHPIITINPVSTTDRSTSVPNMLLSSTPLSSSPTTTDKTHKQQRPLKTMRTWLKSSRFGRFVQSFNKNSRQNQNVISNTHRQLTQTNNPTDLIY